MGGGCLSSCWLLVVLKGESDLLNWPESGIGFVCHLHSFLLPSLSRLFLSLLNFLES